MAVAPQLQQRIPFVDGERRLTNEALRALNDAFKTVVDALNAAIVAQETADAAQDAAIDAAQAAANAALQAAQAALDAAAAQSTADGATASAASAQGTANAALALANTAVQQNVGSAWAPTSGTDSRGLFTTYVGQTISNPPTQAEVQGIDNHVVALSQHMKALIDDLSANGALTT